MSNPKNESQSAFQCGVVALESNSYEEALLYFGRALELNGLLAEAAFYQGRAFLKLNDAYSAIAAFTYAIGVEPNYYEAYVERGYAQSLLEEGEKAIADFNWAIALNPDRKEGYWGKAVTSFGIHELGQSLDCLNWLISEDFKAGIYYQLRGCIRLNMKQEDGALIDFTSAIHLAPEDPINYFNRAGIYQLKGELELALVDYASTLRLATSEMDEICACVRLERGRIFEQQQEYSSAFYEFDQGVILLPEDYTLLHHRGKSLLSLQQVTAALESLEAAVVLNGACLEAIYDRLVARFLTQDYIGALEDVNRLAQQGIASKKLLYYKACCILEVGPNQVVAVEMLKELEQQLRGNEEEILLNQIRSILAIADRPALYHETTPAQLLAELEFSKGDLTALLVRILGDENTEISEIAPRKWKLVELKDDPAQALIEFHPEQGWLCPIWVKEQLSAGIASSYNNLGISHAQEGRLDAALECFNRGLSIVLDDPALLMNRGRAYLGLGEPHSALADFTAVCMREYPTADYHRRRADVLFQLGDIQGAIEGYQQTLVLEPSHTLCQKKLSVLMALSKHQLQALSLYQQAETASISIKDSSVSWNRVIELLTQAFNLSDTFPGISEAYYLYGVTCEKLGISPEQSFYRKSSE
jgi:tetratricopeptide (TPR) repeat protein